MLNDDWYDILFSYKASSYRFVLIRYCGDPNLQTLLIKIVDLGSQFICWWVSSQSYRLCFKHSLDSLTIKHPYGFQPNTFFPLDLASCFLCSLCFLLHLLVSTPSPISFLPLFLTSLKNQPPICLPSLSYIPPLSGVQIITFHWFPCNPTFTHNP